MNESIRHPAAGRAYTIIEDKEASLWVLLGSAISTLGRQAKDSKMERIVALWLVTGQYFDTEGRM